MKNTTKIFIKLIILLLFVSLTNIEAQTKKPAHAERNVKQKIQPGETPVEYMPDAEMLKTLQDKVSVVESKKDWAEFNRRRPIINANRTRSAYIAVFKNKVEDVEYLLDVIVVHDSRTDKFYEIRGLEFPRPLEKLNWKSNDVLIFDQWLNPHRGGRYSVNFKLGKLVGLGFIE